MAEKIFTITLKVDLDCPRCYKKIRKILCKLQDRENIQTISFDDAKKTVTVTGPFSTTNMAKKLVCKACRSIKEIQIIELKPPPPAPPTPPTPEKIKEVEESNTKAPANPKPEPVMVPVVQFCVAGQACRCIVEGGCGWCRREGPGGRRPCLCGCGGVYRPCSCGCGQGYAPGSFYGGYKMPCQIIIDEQPATCTIM